MAYFKRKQRGTRKSGGLGPYKKKTRPSTTRVKRNPVRQANKAANRRYRKGK